MSVPTGGAEVVMGMLIASLTPSDEPPVRDRYFYGDMWMRSDGVLHTYEHSPVGGRWVAANADKPLSAADLALLTSTRPVRR